MKRFDPAIGFSLFLAACALYLRTLAPSLLYGDSAEFQTIAYTLGLGHPTGYPIYILLAKLFTFIPVGDVAYRVNLFSAVCAALTVGLIYFIIRSLGGRVLSAIYGSLALTLMPLFWKHASIAEIYTLSAACLAFILLAVVQWKRSTQLRWLFMAGLVGGVSLGIHTTVVLAVPAILIYIAISSFFPPTAVEEGYRTKTILIAASGAILGAVMFLSTFYFLDSLDSRAGYYNTAVRPSLSVWGMTPADFDSPFERLAFLYFPPQFKDQFFNVTSKEITTRLQGFWDDAVLNVLLGSIAVVSLLLPRKDSPSRWRETLLLVLAFVTFMFFALTYNVDDFYVYYIPVFVVLTILVGLGVDAILDLFMLIPRLSRFVPVGLGIVLLIFGLFSTVPDVPNRWQERVPPGLEDWEIHFFSFPDARRLEAEQIVNGIEDNAIVFTDWDRAYGFYYAAQVLQGRTGVSVHEAYPQDGVTQPADSTIAYIEANADSHPIYFSERPSQLARLYKITRAGSGLFRIERK